MIDIYELEYKRCLCYQWMINCTFDIESQIVGHGKISSYQHYDNGS